MFAVAVSGSLSRPPHRHAHVRVPVVVAHVLLVRVLVLVALEREREPASSCVREQLAHAHARSISCCLRVLSCTSGVRRDAELAACNERGTA